MKFERCITAIENRMSDVSSKVKVAAILNCWLIGCLYEEQNYILAIEQVVKNTQIF